MSYIIIIIIIIIFKLKNWFRTNAVLYADFTYVEVALAFEWICAIYELILGNHSF